MTDSATTDHVEPGASRPFEADVAKLLHLMVHSVYSDKDVFLRELVSNAADACEKLRYEAIARPELLGEDPKPKITIALDPDAKTLTIGDNGIGMSADDMAEALGTIARSGTRAFMDRIGAQASEGDAVRLPVVDPPAHAGVARDLSLGSDVLHAQLASAAPATQQAREQRRAELWRAAGTRRDVLAHHRTDRLRPLPLDVTLMRARLQRQPLRARCAPGPRLGAGRVVAVVAAMGCLVPGCGVTGRA